MSLERFIHPTPHPLSNLRDLAPSVITSLFSLNLCPTSSAGFPPQYVNTFKPPHLEKRLFPGPHVFPDYLSISPSFDRHLLERNSTWFISILSLQLHRLWLLHSALHRYTLGKVTRAVLFRLYCTLSLLKLDVSFWSLSVSLPLKVLHSLCSSSLLFLRINVVFLPASLSECWSS